MKFECDSEPKDSIYVHPHPTRADVIVALVEEHQSGEAAVWLTSDKARALAKHILSLLPPEANEG